MSRFLAVLFLASVTLVAAVNVTRDGNVVHIEIDGRPFSDFYFGPEAPKPYLHPLRSASGRIVTRRFPMEKVEGETTSDVHHRGLWLGYSSVNGFDFWQNEVSENNKLAGKVVTVRVSDLKSGDAGSLRGVFRWLSPLGEPMLEETRVMVFRGGVFRAAGALRIVDVDISLQALVDTTFGDSKDGAFCIRLAEPLIERNGGVITNSAGGRGMKETWGKQANWVDYAGTLQGEPVGIAMFDHPASFHHAPRWHVRDYGLLGLNPFGASAFDKELPDSTFTLPKGKSLRLRYRFVIHGEVSGAEIERLYEEFAKEP